MFNLRKLVILCAALGLASVVYADQYQTAPTMTKGQPTMETAKMEKNKKMMCKLDIMEINKATAMDLEKAVSPKMAKHIIDVRTKMGGKFTDEMQFKKEVKIGKKAMHKLTKTFCMKE